MRVENIEKIDIEVYILRRKTLRGKIIEGKILRSKDFEERKY